MIIGPLLSYLKQKVSYYDLQYALRLCIEHKKQMACVVIYSKMGLYEVLLHCNMNRLY
jgi:hypothetical protein